MAKSSYVLHALKILGLEEILKLSKVLHIKQGPLKKAAGEELVSWDGASQEASAHPTKPVATILDFPKKNNPDPGTGPEEPRQEKKEDVPSLLASDLVLWQREMSRTQVENVHKLDAVQGYKKSAEMYAVKTTGVDGKDKIRFASTNGILINKKQA